MADVKAPAGQPAPGTVKGAGPANVDDGEMETPGKVTKEQKGQYKSAFDQARADHKAGAAAAPAAAAKPGLSLGKSRDGSVKASKGPAAGGAAAAEPVAGANEGDGDIEDIEDGGEPAAEIVGDAGAEGDAGEDEGDGDGDEPDPALVVTIPPRREGEEELNFVAETQADADRLRELLNGNMRREDAYRVRDEAEQVREESEELRYRMEADPEGFVLSTLGTVDDLSNLVRFALTRGNGRVLEATKAWLQGVLDTPEAFDGERERADARRVTRRDKVSRDINQQRHVTRNARSVVAAVRTSMDDMLPAGFAHRDRLYDDVIGDIQRDAERHNRLFDAKNVAAVVKERLSLYGVTVGAKPEPKPTGGVRPVGSPAPAKPNGAQLKRNSDQRRKAASPGPGVGSPLAGIPKLPPSKNLEEGKTAIKRAFAHVKKAYLDRKKQPS